MGQTIEVSTEVIGEVALLMGDRSITGQDGEAYSSADQARSNKTFVAALAAALFRVDSEIEHVYAQSNVASVVRPGGWDEAAVARAADLLRHFFRFYPDGGAGGLALSAVGPAFAVVEMEPAVDEETAEALRSQHYNATIAAIRRIHDNLWVIWVRPDGDLPQYEAGQYATLGLGYWEPRLDGRREVLDPDRVQKLILRSFSMSSSILDENGALLDPEDETELEFYVVLVEKERDETPALLTPRLFLKDEGDRIYMGRKIAGRYRLDKVEDPEADLLFLSTGTGEAPHNQMVLHLLRNGHQGKILAACTVRYRQDLGYLEVQRELERRFPNYKYLALTTREPENEGNKLYIQDMIESGALEEELGKPLDPDKTHVFLCGNPAMIGLPEWEDDEPVWPEPKGAAQVLVERGFTLDRRGVEGNVHYEEYW